MSKPDYYAVLGVAPDSDDVVVQAAYKALMRKFHPDKNTNSDATARAKQINEAFQTLGNADKRAAYDSYRRAKSAHEKSKDTPPPRPSSTTPPASQPPPLKKEGGEESLAFWTTSKVIAGIFFAMILVVSIKSGSNDRSTLATDANMMVTELNASDSMDADTPLAGDATSASADVNSLISNIISPDPLTDLTGPPRPVAFSDIETAAQKFDTIMARSGIAGAKAYSQSCHKSATKSGEWSKHDFCAAFDFSAAYFDRSVSRTAGYPENAYFTFMDANQKDQYSSSGIGYFGLENRLQSIRRAVPSTLDDLMQARLASQKTASPPATQTTEILPSASDNSM